MALAWTLRDPRVTSTLDRREQRRAARGRTSRALDRLDFTHDELAEIDRYAADSGINLWAPSSSV